MVTALVAVTALVLALAGLTLALVRRERRARALAERLDAADPGSGTRAHADAQREQEGQRGQAGGLSMGGAGHNSAAP